MKKPIPPHRPTLGEYDELKKLSGHVTVQKRLKRARALVSYSDDCFTASQITDIRNGAKLSESEVTHFEACRHCRACLKSNE